MYDSVHACIHTCIHIYIHMHVYVRACVCVVTFASRHVQVCLHVLHVWKDTHVRVCMYASVRMYVCVSGWWPSLLGTYRYVCMYYMCGKMHTCVCICECVCAYVCMCVCMCGGLRFWAHTGMFAFITLYEKVRTCTYTYIYTSSLRKTRSLTR